MSDTLVGVFALLMVSCSVDVKNLLSLDIWLMCLLLLNQCYF